MLKCKICKSKVVVIGENSAIEPAIQCTQCGFTNKKENKRYKKDVVIEYVNR